MLRARAFRDRRHAITLVTGAALSLFAIPTHYGFAADAGATGVVLASAAAVVGLALAALVAGAIVPTYMFSEPVREVVEYARIRRHHRGGGLRRVDHRPCPIRQVPLMRAKAAASALAAAALLAAHVVAAPTAMAVAPPVIDPGALPPAETPGPAEEMRQSEACILPVVIADPNVAQPAPGNAMLNVTQAWQYSTGAGVTVAIIDTGVTPNPRFPSLFAGGDYVQGLPNGGLTDCDNHGSFVASIIGAAPSNPASRPAPETGRCGRTGRTAAGAGQSSTAAAHAASTAARRRSR